MNQLPSLAASAILRSSLPRAVARVLFLFLLALSVWSATGANISWTNTSGGNWNVAANWDSGTVPGANDNAFVTNNGSYTVTIDTDTSINTLTVGGGSGTQILSQVAATFTINGAGTVGTNGILTMSSGTLAGSGNVTVTGTLNWTVGTMSGSGQTVIANTGTLHLAGAGSTATLGRVLRNDGVADWLGGNLLMIGGTFNNYGSFTASNSAVEICYDGGGINAFNNYGTFTKQGAGELQFSARSTSVSFNNFGTVDVQGGMLRLEGGMNSSAMQVTGAGTLTLAASYTHAAGSSLSGGGTVTFILGTHSFPAGTFLPTGPVNFNGGTITINNTFTPSALALSGAAVVNLNASVSSANLTMSAGMLSGSGDLTVTGAADWTGGTMSGSGQTVIANTGTLHLGAVGNTMTLNRVMRNDGAAQWTGVTGQNLQMVGGTFNNYGTCIVSNVGGANNVLTCYDEGGVNAFNNYGTFTKQGAGELLFSARSTSVSFNNFGTVDVQGGMLRLEGGMNSSAMQVTGAGTLTLAASYTHAAGSSLSGGGTVTFILGTHSFPAGTFLPTGPVNFTGGTITINNPFTPTVVSIGGAAVNLNAAQNFSNLAMSGGTLAGSGNVTITGTLDWTGGTMAGSGQTVIANGGTLSLSTFNIKQLNRVLQNDGTATWTAGELRMTGGTFNNNGSFTAGGNFPLRSSGSGGVNAFNNAGTFTKLGIPFVRFTSVTTGVPFNNSGTVEVRSGTLVLDNGFTLAPSSVLQFMIGGRAPRTDFGSIEVAGQLALRGVANIVLTNGFAPAPGEVFQLIEWDSQSGGFTQINGLDLDGDVYFQAVCDARFLKLHAFSSVAAPSIPGTNLVSQIVAVGRNASFCITPLGAEPFTYQWRLNGTNFPGETTACLIVTNAATNSAVLYCVAVGDALNVTNTYCATLTVLTPPSIIAQTDNTTNSLSINKTFTVFASGSPPLQYQWRLNGANIAGATNIVYAISNAQPRDGGSYSVTVGNRVGAVSSAVATLVANTNALPFADNFAARGTISGVFGVGGGVNTNATFETGEPRHAGKTGGKSLWLQWTAPTNGVAVFNTRGSSFDTLLAIYIGDSLATLSTNVSDEDRGGFFTSEAAFSAQAGSNYLIAIDGFFGATGHVVLTWNLDTNLTAVPRIIQQPFGATAVAGSSATFTVFAASSTNLTYQWYFNCCLAIAGATNATLTIPNVSALDLGYYTVEVMSAGGTVVRSAQASLEIGPDSQLQSQDKFEDLLINGVAGLAGGKGEPKPLVSVSAGTVSSQNISLSGSTTQSSETNHCGIIGGVSRWLSLKALTNATFVINTIGSTLDTVLAVYVGSNLLNLQFVACDNNSAPDGLRSVVRFPATAGVTYMVAVDSVGGLPGIIQVNWGIGSVPVLNVTPTNFSASAGGTLTFNVAPTNSNPAPRYQWYLNQAVINGATNASFNLTNVSSRQGGRYSVIVSNFVGSLTSLVAVVNVPPSFVVRGFAENVNGALQFRLNGSATEAALLQATTNFAQWQPLFTNQMPNAPFIFTDTTASNRPLRFYRVVPAP